MNTIKTIFVTTLGQFQVSCNGQVLTESAGRSYKLWDLFKLLLINRGKAIGPEQIMEILWPDQDLENDKGALRTLVYRLRKVLELGTDGCGSINLHNGSYSLVLDDRVEVDTDRFERLIRQGVALSENHPNEAMIPLREAVDLYKGEFLAECSYFDWVLPARNYYHRLHMEAVMSLAQLLDQTGQHADRARLCEKALLVEPYDEELHLIFIDALVKDGRRRQALSHYEYITGKLYRELGVKPSQAMRSLYRQLKTSDVVNLDISSIQHGLKGRQEQEGAFLCEPDVFRSIYELERRRGERSGQAVFLCLVTIATEEHTLPAQPVLRECMDKLKVILVDSLRRGDVVTGWNEAQCLVILPGLRQEHAEMILSRVHTRFIAACRLHSVGLKTNAQPVLPPLVFTTA